MSLTKARPILIRPLSNRSPAIFTASPSRYPYRSAQGASAATFAHYLEDAFKRVVAPESVAGGDSASLCSARAASGAPRDYFRPLGNLPQARHPFIADEVQSGIGRTGKWFASEHFGIGNYNGQISSAEACLWPRSPAARKSWILPALEAWAARSPAIRLLARRHWLRLKRLKRKGCWLVLPPSGSASKSAARAWQKKWPLSAIFGSWRHVCGRTRSRHRDA